MYKLTGFVDSLRMDTHLPTLGLSVLKCWGGWGANGVGVCFQDANVVHICMECTRWDEEKGIYIQASSYLLSRTNL